MNTLYSLDKYVCLILVNVLMSMDVQCKCAMRLCYAHVVGIQYKEFCDQWVKLQLPYFVQMKSS
jgi:hypothetical protein